jgi:hypothetical protein
VFRLTDGGQVDQIDFSAIYHTDDLHMTLLFRLLSRPNLSYDFMYGLQQGVEEIRRQETPVEERVDDFGADQVSREALGTLRKLEAERRLEFSNWRYDAPQVPRSPGVLLFYESPFRLLWAESVSNLHDALARHVQGQVGNFTLEFLHHKVMHILRTREVEQLLEGKLSFESVVGFRIRQFVSYRFYVADSPEVRRRLVDLIWSGASKYGAPGLPRPDGQSDRPMG